MKPELLRMEDAPDPGEPPPQRHTGTRRPPCVPALIIAVVGLPGAFSVDLAAAYAPLLRGLRQRS